MKNKVLIIAEAGVNHNGDFSTAKKLIDAAATAGADYIKFQTFKADKIVTKDAVKADYQVRNIKDGDDSQYNMLKKLEMPYEWHFKLKEYAESKGLLFLSTAFDEDSVEFLEELGMPFYKIPSGEITNRPYLIQIARKKKPVILSTGMSDLGEIKAAADLLISQGVDRHKITVLHCNTEYPTPMSDVNLLAMNTIAKELGFPVGYSDHTLGIEVPIAAVALGAVVIEKHFTLDKTMLGPDHLASLEPDELRDMVTAIRNIEQAISGTGEKVISNSEGKNKIIARKSLFYRAALKAGHKILESDLICLRPGSGISPMDIDKVLNKELKQDVSANSIVELNHYS